MARMGDGMRSKWYKLMGGEQRKRLWVLKTTSQNATGPKPKYVGKIVAALWEKQLTMGSVFMLLRERPLAESPVVAMKALITLMKVCLALRRVASRLLRVALRCVALRCVALLGFARLGLAWLSCALHSVSFRSVWVCGWVF